MNTVMRSLQPPLARARRLWRASPVPAFLRWWGGELRQLLPAPIRRALTDGAVWFLLEQAADDWRLRRDGAATPLARWPAEAPSADVQARLAGAMADVEAGDRRLALLLPPARVLRRVLSLPRAAAADLHQVGAFEMDRQTPFRVEQVYYTLRVLPAAAPPGRLAVELVAVPRGILDAQLAALRTAGIAVDAVDVASGDGRLGVDLLPAGQAPRHPRPRLRLNLGLAALCAVLLVLGLGQWRHNREAALAQMREEVAALRAQAQTVAALRQQWQDEVGAAGFLLERKRQATSRLALLDELTQRLPPNAWLERLSLDAGGQLALQGQAQQAVRLIDALKDSPLIADPNFQGSIQPDPTTGRDRFYLLAHLRQPAQGSPGATP